MRWDGLSTSSPEDIVTWASEQPWCRAMAECRQDAGCHAEGDVWTHTKMVCAQLPRLDEGPDLDDHERTVLSLSWCERIWTVMATCSQQGRSVFAYLEAAVTAWFAGEEAPSLRPRGA